MTVDRFLGAGWASVHGPADARRLLHWTLDHGFRGLLASPSPRTVSWTALRQEQSNLPFRFAGARVSGVYDAERPAEADLAAGRAPDRQATHAVVAAAVRLAEALGCPRVILEPGLVEVRGEVAHRDLGDPAAGWDAAAAGALWTRRGVGLDRALDHLCRSLHGLCKSFPHMDFCLTLSRNVLGLGEPAALAAVFEDLGRYRIRYWHDTVAAACRERFLGEDPGRALEDLSKRLSGMTLGDVGDGVPYLPPGSGGVDYPLLSAYRQPTTTAFPVVIELDPCVDPGEIPGLHSFLDKFGL